jgi:metal-dependent amidase/aminoacylase/carboxypeptidase family protein
MAKKGFFRKIDANMMMHPSGETRAMVNFLALAELRFRFHGKASHASAAHEKESTRWMAFSPHSAPFPLSGSTFRRAPRSTE